MDWFAYLTAALFGLLFGSFANVVIWRLPRGESLSTPASKCPSCDTPIEWRDNVPVLSWLLLRGRCRRCGASISGRYPLVELTSAGLWMLMWHLYGATAALFFAILFVYLLMVLAFIDLDTMRLPNSLVGLLAGAGSIGVVAAQVTGVWMVPLLPASGWLGEPWAAAAFGLLVGGALPLAISALYSAIRGRHGMGMGDVKLLGAMGIFLGPYVIMALVFGSVVGAVAAVATPRSREAHAKIPFGPFLAIGAIGCLVVGPWVWAWYAQFL